MTKGSGEAEGSNVDANWFLGIDSATNTLAADFEDTIDGSNHPVFGTTPITSGRSGTTPRSRTTRPPALEPVPRRDTRSDPGPRERVQPRADSIQHAGLATRPYNSTGTAAGAFNSVLDQVRISNVARSGAQIAADRTAEVTSGPGLVARVRPRRGHRHQHRELGRGRPHRHRGQRPDLDHRLSRAPMRSRPAAPTGLDTTPGNGLVGLAWTANAEPDLAGYRVFRSETLPVSVTGERLSAAASLVTGPAYTDHTVVNDTLYHYAVIAVDASGNRSAASDPADATLNFTAGAALSFDGFNDYVTFGAAASLNTTDFTIETWFRRDGAGVGVTTGAGGIGSAIPLIAKGGRRPSRRPTST